MRPRQVVGFEVLMVASLALGGIETARDWPNVVAYYAPLSPSPEWIAALVVIVTLGLVLLLTLLASRWHSVAALILLLLLFVGGLPQVAHQLMATGVSGAPVLAQVALAAQLAAFVLAATQPARRWFGAGRGQPTDDESSVSGAFPS